MQLTHLWNMRKAACAIPLKIIDKIVFMLNNYPCQGKKGTTMSSMADKFNAAAGAANDNGARDRRDDHDGGGGGTAPAVSVRKRVQKRFAGRKIRGGSA